MRLRDLVIGNKDWDDTSAISPAVYLHHGKAGIVKCANSLADHLYFALTAPLKKQAAFVIMKTKKLSGLQGEAGWKNTGCRSCCWQYLKRWLLHFGWQWITCFICSISAILFFHRIGHLLIHQEVSTRPSGGAAPGRTVYAGLSGTGLPGKYADRGVLVLSVYRCIWGGNHSLCGRQDIWTADLWKRVVWLCLLDGDGIWLSSLQSAKAATKENRMDPVYHLCGVTDLCGIPLFGACGQYGKDHVLGVHCRKPAVWCCWYRIGIPFQGQQGFLQIHMSDHRIPETNELFFLAPDKMRYEQVHILRQVQTCMSHGCRRNGPFEKEREWYGMYSVLWMCKGLPEGCFVDENWNW